MVKLYKLWIFQRESGLNLIDATIDELESGEIIDGNLISGLLTSFMLFSNEILGEDMRLIETSTFRLIFSVDRQLVMVLMMNKKGPIQMAEKILERLRKLFEKKFSEQIDASNRGDMSDFPEITQKIEEITQKRGVKLMHEIAKREALKHTEKLRNQLHEFIITLKNK